MPEPALATIALVLTVTHGVTADEIVSTRMAEVTDMTASPATIAAMLRQLADDLDPPKPITRGG